MARFPLRLGRLRSIWEDGTPQEIARVEFPNRSGGVDLRPSVYRVEALEVDQARSEHLANFMNPPGPAGAVDVNLDGLAPLTDVLGQGNFQFTNARHAELVVPSAAAIERIAETVKTDSTRRMPRSVEDVLSYVSARIDAADPEWERMLNERPKWKKAVEKWRARRTPLH